MPVAIATLLLGLAFLVPEHYLPWDTFRSQFVAAIALLTLAIGALLGRTSNIDRTWAWPGIAAVPLCLVPLPWLQWAFGTITFLSDALLPSMYLMALALVIGVGARWATIDRTAVLSSLVVGILFASMLSTAFAIGQWLQVDGLPFMLQMAAGSRPGANLAQPNHLATLLVMGLSCALLSYERRWLSGATGSLLAAVLGFGLVCTMSRSGGMSAVGLVLLAVLARQRLGLRVTARALLLWLAYVSTLVMCWDVLSNALGMSSAVLADRLQAGTRLTHWAVISDAIRLAPWTGHGWNQVAMAQQATAHLHPLTGELIQNSHNAWLDLWVWIGLPAGTLAGGAVAWWFFSRWVRCHDGTAACLMAAISAVLVHSMLEYPGDYAYFLLPMGLMMGLVDGMSTRTTAAVTTGRAVPALAILGSAAMLAWVTVEYLQIEDSFRDARVGLLGFNNRVEIVQPPAVLLLDGPREYHRLMITPAGPNMDANTLAWMRSVTQRYPFPPALMRYALAAGLNGQPEDAIRALRGLCSVHPPTRCDEGRAGWAAAQTQHPALLAIRFPPRNET